MQQDADLSTRPEQPPDSTYTVNRIGIRVPPFWSEKPAVWFAQLEGQFALSNITQDATKFYCIVSQLDNKYAAEVWDVITNPPPTGRYDRIKAELIRRLSLSEEQRVRQLVMQEEMGDRRPTQFLRHLRTLAGPSIPSDFLRTLWTNRLPPNIQAIIATQARVALDDVAQLADKIAEVTPPPCVACESSPGVDINSLTTRVDELARQIAALSASASRPRSPSQTRRHARRSSRSAGRSPAPDICWYHRRFKERAERCSASCTWQQGNMDGSRLWRQASATTQPAACM
jgi:hypothetical protein